LLFPPLELGHPGRFHFRDFAGSQPQSTHFTSLFSSGSGIALSLHQKAGKMPEKDFYLLIILSAITGFLLIRIVMARIGRHRQSRRLEREIAEYVRKRAAGQHN
jgi:hypothetical protein